MTQIVYDGEYLYADRKAYSHSQFAGETRKVKSISKGNMTHIYAFSGSFLECKLGEECVESFFDPEVCKHARERLSPESLENFDGIVVETPIITRGVDSHRVFLVNYAGDKCEFEKGKFLAVGALSSDIMLAHRVATGFGKLDVDTEELIRFVTNNTTQHQNDYPIDKVKIYTGV